MCKEQRACIDCGKLSSPKYRSQFSTLREEYRCHRCAQKKRFEDPKEREKMSELKKKYCEDPKVREKMSAMRKKYFEDPNARKRNGESTKENFKNSETRKKHRETQKKVKGTLEARKRQSDVTKKYFENLETRKRHSEIAKKYFIDKQWYGSVKYYDGRIYCVKWTENLRKRVREYFGNKSVISGKGVEENGGRQLSVHHVYYQKKACCEWDEDMNGYYCYIDGERYNIKGDPNKFVPLTAGENIMVEKDKLQWIKFFESKIEDELGGKCYYTKEEFDMLL